MKTLEKPKLIGRDNIVTAIFETLLRVEKPNVILTGEPGVGKTAIVEYIKYLIDQRAVPEGLKNYSVEFINLNDLLAGPGYRGVFEQRLKDTFKKYIGTSTILFMDEFHTAENLGAMNEGKAPGLGNFLKPILTGGNMRIIAATTTKEYEEKMTDGALKRRLRRIHIHEPDESVIRAIIKARMVEFNLTHIPIEDEAYMVDEIYNLSVKLEGYNPDIAVDITDIVFAKARLYEAEKLDSELFDGYLIEIEEVKEAAKQYNL